MAVKVQNTSQIGADGGVKMLIYGAANMGKTPLCATAPEPLIIDCERKIDSIQTSVDYITVDSYDQLKDVMKWAEESKEAVKYQTICFDTVSEMAEIMRYDFVKKYAPKDQRQAFYDAQDKVTDIIRRFKRLPRKHIVFVCKQQLNTTPTGAQCYGPQAPGKQLPETLPNTVNEVFALRNYLDPNTNIKHPFLQTAWDAEYFARDCSYKLEKFEKSDLTYIIDKILS